MIESQDYKDFDNAENTFLGKMNYLGDGSDIDSLGTIGWITANLSQTDFASVTAAETEYYNLLALQDVVLDDNSDFFDAFLDEDNHEDLIDIMFEPTTYFQDPCGCTSAFNACKNGVERKYTAAVAVAGSLKPIISQKAYKSAMADAQRDKKFGIGECDRSYENCKLGCD